MNIALWIVQVLLAGLFVFAGGSKWMLPPEQMTAQIPWPVPFILFIGVCELLGAVGLIIPALLRIRPGLTPLAAAGLVIIMLGATVITAVVMGIGTALMPLAALLLAAYVAYGRWRLAPIQPR
ncbi:MAG TPA: DoxX family protein, partial [bacterium]